MIPSDFRCVWLHDGAAGNRRQAQALVEALGVPASELLLAPCAPWRWLAPRGLIGASQAFGPAFSALCRNPPALVLGCGRQAALATRVLKQLGSRAVQILDPRLHPSHWDVVIAPRHDRLNGDNVLSLCGSLNPITPAWLVAARASFSQFAALPTPRMGVLIGGHTRAAPFDQAAFTRLADRLDAARAEHGGSLLVLGSRRSDPRIATLARQRWVNTPGLRWFDDRDGDNPYAGVMGWADRFVLSADSVNMVSEACSTPAPVYVAEPDLASGRIRSFLDDLLAQGRIRAQDERLAPFAVLALDETGRIAAELAQQLRLGLPGRGLRRSYDGAGAGGGDDEKSSP